MTDTADAMKISTMIKAILSAVAVLAVLLGIALYFACKMFEVPTACEASPMIRDAIKEKLSPAEASTLKPITTLTDETEACSSTFAYMRNGNGERIVVSGLVDPIHGIKFGPWDWAEMNGHPKGR